MEELFFAKIDDLRSRAERGELAFSGFLNESERAEAQRYLNSLGEKRALFWGGYDGAERTKLFVFPDWLEASSEPLDEYVVPLLISGSGFVRLDHRAFLGSLLATGIARSVVGDIVIQDDGRSAVVFFDDRIAEYMLTSPDALVRVGRDKVKITRYRIPYGFGRRENFVGINVTVASARLDGVISALVSVSREKAKSMVREGLVQLDHVEALNPDAAVTDGSVISVRGHGKFKIESISEKTKKDRLRLIALKYV